MLFRSEKYTSWISECSSDVIEVWLHKWEEAFAICEIRSDLKKICEATHMFIEAVDRWWIKQQKDKVAPIAWEGFKSEFKKHFLPPDEESRAWDAYRSLRQRNLSATEYTDKFRECVMKITDPLPMSIQLKDYIYGLNDRIKMEFRAKYVTTLDESIAVALNYEDARETKWVCAGRASARVPKKGRVSEKMDIEIKCPSA